MTLKNPSPFFRALVLGAQGVFYNAFCKNFFRFDSLGYQSLIASVVLCYMISPSTCHRFVGHLEEEAVVT